MTNLNTVLNDRITRLAKREAKAFAGPAKALVSRCRKQVAALAREVAALKKTVAFLEAQAGRQLLVSEPAPADLGDIRFRVDGLRTHRAKLGLNQAEYGKLLGVSAASVQGWESGRRPRKAQLVRIVALRGLGKREALKRLEALGVAKASTRANRGQTANQFIVSFVKATGTPTTADINAAWSGSRRPGNANNTLSRLVAEKALVRTKRPGKKGSVYRIGQGG